ncbi:hypothetical protein CDAR_539141 [Caerostris darwini]|uniref:Uncharacterized protein n=1 Tax=Caerostris darwini TaxID=1538125 RepID=A0AAV4T0F1_9ARAC|nr:hypothetical protein CDAR_539141 [Caerostris darwini]
MGLFFLYRYAKDIGYCRARRWPGAKNCKWSVNSPDEEIWNQDESIRGINVPFMTDVDGLSGRLSVEIKLSDFTMRPLHVIRSINGTEFSVLRKRFTYFKKGLKTITIRINLRLTAQLNRGAGESARLENRSASLCAGAASLAFFGEGAPAQWRTTIPPENESRSNKAFVYTSPPFVVAANLCLIVSGKNGPLGPPCLNSGMTPVELLPFQMHYGKE